MTDFYHVYGAPGTGKTRMIGREVAALLDKSGVDPSLVGLYTFRTHAAEDNKRRIEKVTGRQLKGARTMHKEGYSLVMQEMGSYVAPADIRARRQFAEETGWPRPQSYVRESEWIREEVDTVDFWTAYSDWITRFPGQSLDRVVHQLRLPHNINLDEFCRWIDDWEDWKVEHDYIDYHDMLARCLEYGLIPPREHMFFDEAQDQYPILHMVAKLWMRGAETVYIVGDPYQSIYSYNGASPEKFMQSPGEPIVLEKTDRIPKRIWDLNRAIVREYLPNYFPAGMGLDTVDADDREASIHRVGSEVLNRLVTRLEAAGEPVLVLTRTRAQMQSVAARLAREGIVFQSMFLRGSSDQYGWPPDAEALVNLRLLLDQHEDEIPKAMVNALYYCARNQFWIKPDNWKRVIRPHKLLSREWIRKNAYHHKSVEQIWEAAVGSQRSAIAAGIRARVRDRRPVPPRSSRMIRLGTIHSAKGAESVAVILFDSLPERIAESVASDPSRLAEEARVFYVGTTRSSKRLYLMSEPETPRFPIPI